VRSLQGIVLCFKPLPKGAFRALLFLCILLCQSTLFGLERYGAIEIGGKGVKGYVVELEQNQAHIRYRDSYNTAPQSGIDSNFILSQEMINHISDDVARLKKALLKDQNISEKELFIIASSALNKIQNKPALEASIESKTHLKLSFIDERQESMYAFYGSVPKAQWRTSSMMDIGGGNTKVAWIDEKNRLDFFEIPLGTVSTTQRADMLENNASFEANCLSVIQNTLTPFPTAASKETLYTSGGIFWATAYLKTNGNLESFVHLQKEDFERVISTFSREPMHCSDDATPNCFLLHYYGAKNLVAGAILAKESIEKLHFFDHEIYFAKDGTWVIGWLMMR
jgi:exopolyphosphatase/pppGpp-phosphohydrolase